MVVVEITIAANPPPIYRLYVREGDVLSVPVLTALSKYMGKLSFTIYVQQEVGELIYYIVLHVQRFREVKPARRASQRKERTEKVLNTHHEHPVSALIEQFKNWDS